ncbi:MAG: tetratricopeptide repeat protein [Bacteroidia bacterium]|nr:tetratricopeptide repeat protein [Bacteroidia bacterium]
MKKKRIAYRIFGVFAIALAAFVLVSCSTKKNTWSRRAWHNMTGHYNVWWNGNQSMKEGELALRQSAIDDYTKTLPVFNYGTKENATAQNAKFDRTIEKSAICIQKHSMRFNGKEHVRCIDDAFIDMAKAHFYKQDFVPARRTFDYANVSYPTSRDHYTANLWLAKTYIATKEYEKAEAALQSLLVTSASGEKLPKYVQRNLDLVFADYYIAVGREKEAVKYLRSALFTAKGKYNKSRAMFILGQIYADQKEYAKATEQFKNVIKAHPEYVMTFESRMNIAKCSTGSDTTAMLKMLRKMLKDTKNTDYKDRIYYAMSDVVLREGDRQTGIDYLRKSVAASNTNVNQKIKSSMEVADMLFSDGEYVLSQAYFDTAVMSMDRTYPGYDSLLNLSVMLSDLVGNLSTYDLNDSLLRLSVMDTVHLYAVIDKIIEDYQAEQERLAKEAETKAQIELLGGTADPQMSMPTGDNSSWYFYNSTTRTRGMNDFQKKWGKRVLEDYWFITNKQSMNQSDEELLSEEELAEMSDEERASYMKEHGLSDTPADTAKYTQLDRGYYLRQIPFTDEAKAEANKQIATALNNVGFIYYNDLKDYVHSIEAYTELTERYPDNDNELSAWFYLYRMHTKRGEETEADNYKNLVLTKYPDSNQAKLILDPEHFLKEAQKGAEAEQFYTKTFDAYQNGQYQRVRMNVERARRLYAEDTLLMPRFEFLDAISLGYVEVVDSMAYALYRLVQNYPESSIKPFAMEVLLKANDMYNLGLNIESARPKEEVAEEEKESIYTFNPDEPYYILVICDTKNVRINPLKVRLSDFNKNNFRLLQLTVKNLMYSKEEAMITIEKFENLSATNDYYNALSNNDYVFGGIEAGNYKIIKVSISNYPIFYQQKNIDEYMEFWNQNNK